MQLALNLKLHSEAKFDNFISGSNDLVMDVLKTMALGCADYLNAFIWSLPGEGVSHLLQAVCHHAMQHQQQAVYLPLAECRKYGVSLLNGIEEMSVVCIDDVEMIAGNKLWEEALFHLFNQMREKNKRLIVGAHHAVNEVSFDLPDLISRLQWGVSYKLESLNDSEKIALLQLSAKRRGFHLPLEVAKYLLVHYPRDLRTQLLLLDRLDQLSLQEKHKITLPFVCQNLADFKH